MKKVLGMCLLFFSAFLLSFCEIGGKAESQVYGTDMLNCDVSYPIGTPLRMFFSIITDTHAGDITLLSLKDANNGDIDFVMDEFSIRDISIAGYHEYIIYIRLDVPQKETFITQGTIAIDDQIYPLSFSNFTIKPIHEDYFDADYSLYFASAELFARYYNEYPSGWILEAFEQVEILRVYFSGVHEIITLLIDDEVAENPENLDLLMTKGSSVNIDIFHSDLGAAPWSYTFFNLLVDYKIAGGEGVYTLALPMLNVFSTEGANSNFEKYIEKIEERK